MTESIMNHMATVWLIGAIVLFLWILFRTFRPGVREEMKHNSQIPFAVKDETDGIA
ncbi:MAG: cbb3-type cytochrome c oxidase subunit 3 [Zavarzinia sp.]|nr:cbb3-type cytochrome c oxidase subunit 3 [Zavarzinia sp.]